MAQRERRKRLVVMLNEVEMAELEAVCENQRESKSRIARVAIAVFCGKSQRQATRSSADRFGRES